MAAKSQFVNKWVEFDDKEQSLGTISECYYCTAQIFCGLSILRIF